MHKSLYHRFLFLWKKFVTVGLLEVHALLSFGIIARLPSKNLRAFVSS